MQLSMMNMFVGAVLLCGTSTMATYYQDTCGSIILSSYIPSCDDFKSYLKCVIKDLNLHNLGGGYTSSLPADIEDLLKSYLLIRGVRCDIDFDDLVEEVRKEQTGGYWPPVTTTTEKPYERDHCSYYSPCSHICTNSRGSFPPYVCSCPPGYSLNPIDKRTCEDINECDNPDQCDHRCLNTDGSFRCECDTGFTLQPDQRTCKREIDFCSYYNPCSHTCTNTPGTYRPYVCSCPSGYRLDPINLRTCLDIDECNNRDQCDHRCINTEGSFRCECDAGFTLQPDQRTCKREIDFCSAYNPCSHTCTNTPGTLHPYVCSCPSGYRLNPINKRTCEDIDECREYQHKCDQRCINTEGSYRCDCEVGHTLQADQRTCKKDTPVFRCVANKYEGCKNIPDGDYAICGDECQRGAYITCSNYILHVRDCALGWYAYPNGHRFTAKLVFDPISKRCEFSSTQCPRLYDRYVIRD